MTASDRRRLRSAMTGRRPSCARWPASSCSNGFRSDAPASSRLAVSDVPLGAPLARVGVAHPHVLHYPRCARLCDVSAPDGHERRARLGRQAVSQSSFSVPHVEDPKTHAHDVAVDRGSDVLGRRDQFVTFGELGLLPKTRQQCGLDGFCVGERHLNRCWSGLLSWSAVFASSQSQRQRQQECACCAAEFELEAMHSAALRRR
jgi:hypothetical protein